MDYYNSFRLYFRNIEGRFPLITLRSGHVISHECSLEKSLIQVKNMVVMSPSVTLNLNARSWTSNPWSTNKTGEETFFDKPKEADFIIPQRIQTCWNFFTFYVI